MTAKPVLACELVPAAALEERLPEGVDRYEYAGQAMLPYLVLWQSRRQAALPVLPDRVVVLAPKAKPLVLAFAKEGCVLALVQVEREEVWAALRRVIGPAV